MSWTETDRLRAAHRLKEGKGKISRWFRRMEREVPPALAETARVLAQYPHGLTLRAIQEKLGHPMTLEAVRQRLIRLEDEHGIAYREGKIGKADLWRIRIQVKDT